ncbi:hypothetical protein SETIT_6G142900v2 [Setaria italica]|uniref:Pectinesterase inhibitor domain-containing protein n=1 Tax=Setaria italica TaxID=4555 RepID=A0A368RLI1_SETIT|nr:hypothetical protein SETIT_6G142900v2 [Setaria italica]
MSVEDTCHAAASTDPRMHALCLRTLRTASPPNSKVSTYAAIAAEAAALSCDGTARAVNVLLQGGSLTNMQRTMLSGCYGDLRRAHEAVAAVEGQLGRCVFAHLGRGYGEAMAAIDHCATKLDSLGQTSLHNLVVGDKYRTALASRLGAYP